MFRLYERLVNWFDDTAKKKAPFIYGRLPYLLAVICFVIAVLFFRKCNNQIMMP